MKIKIEVLQCSLSELVGKTVAKIEGLEKGSERVVVFTECVAEYYFFHEWDCCEEVYLEDFDGSAEDLVGAEILSAEEVSDFTAPEVTDPYTISYTWTFYKIETTKGGIWMRWFGESNGCYSEEVTFGKRGAYLK